jgi:hypothetical protein
MVQYKPEYDRSLMGNKCDYFCNIVKWADYKKEAPGEIIRFNILKKHKDGSFEVAVMCNGKQQFKKTYYNDFYRLCKISFN